MSHRLNELSPTLDAFTQGKLSLSDLAIQWRSAAKAHEPALPARYIEVLERVLSQLESAALFTEARAGRHYGLLMLLPPAAQANVKPLPREVIFVIDTSGSMHGDSIAQAKEALEMAVRRLTPADRFNVIEFNSYAKGLWNDARPADADNVEESIIDRIEITKGPTPDTGADSIGGRINMIPRSAFDRSQAELRYRTFVLMNSEFLNLRQTPGGKEGGDGKSYKWFPDFEVTYVNPVSKRFGYSVNASRNDYFYTARLTQKTFSTTNSSVAEPYLNSLNAQVAHSFSRRSALGVKFDFKLTPADTLSVAYNFNRYWVDFGNHQMTYATGTMLAAPATGRTVASGDFR